MLKLLSTTTAPDWAALFEEEMASSAQNEPDIISLIITILSILAGIIAIGTIAMIISKSHKFKQSKQKEDYEGLPGLSKTLEVIMILLGFRVVHAVISIPIAISSIEAMMDSYYLGASLFDFPDELRAAMDKYAEQARQEIITEYVTSIALIVGLFAVSIYAWHCFQEAKKQYAYLFPLGGIHKNPNPQYISQPSYTPTATNQYVPNATAPTNSTNSTEETDMSFFDRFNKPKGQPMGVPAQPTAPMPSDDDIFGTGAASPFMQRDDDTDAKMNELLMSDAPKTSDEPVREEVDVFGSGSESSWGAVADMNDPNMADILVQEETPKGDDLKLDSGDIFGTEDGSGWGTAANMDDPAMADILVQEEAPKGDDLKLDGGDIFGSEDNSGWGTMADMSDPTMSGLLEEDHKENITLDSSDIFGTEEVSGWGSMVDMKDPAVASAIRTDSNQGAGFTLDSGDIFGGGTSDAFNQKQFADDKEETLFDHLLAGDNE